MTKRDRNMAIAWLVLFGFAVVAFLGVCDAYATLWKQGDVDLIINSETYQVYAIDGHLDQEYLKEALITSAFDGISTIHPKYHGDMRQTWITIECWEGCPVGLFHEAVAAEIGWAAKQWAESQD